MKTCTSCGKLKPLSDFSAYAKGGPRCKRCKADYAREWRNRHRERLRKHARETYVWRAADQAGHHRRWLLRRYGLTTEDYDAMLEKQGGVCAICRQPEKAIVGKYGNKNIRRMPVDHDHSTGMVRGLLCSRCNVILGQFEKHNLLKPLFDYLSGF